MAGHQLFYGPPLAYVKKFGPTVAKKIWSPLWAREKILVSPQGERT